MTKTELWANVQEAINAYKFDDKENLLNDLANLLEPKRGGGSMHPPKLNEDGTIAEAWCKYHQTYEPAEQMVLKENGTKSAGYCKAASWVSNNRRREVQKLKLQVLDLFDTDQDAAREARAKMKELEPQINDAKYYDYDADWAAYLKATESK